MQSWGDEVSYRKDKGPAPTASILSSHSQAGKMPLYPRATPHAQREPGRSHLTVHHNYPTTALHSGRHAV